MKRRSGMSAIYSRAVPDIRSAITLKGEGHNYHGQSDIGDNDGVQSAGSVSERLALVTVRVVLVLVDLAVVFALPRHGAVANANVALRGDRGGLFTEVPIDNDW